MSKATHGATGFGCLTLRAVHTLLVAAALTGGILGAQTPRRTLEWGLGGGLAVHSASADLDRLGPAASAFARLRTAPRVAWALEAFITGFEKSSDVVYAPCRELDPCVSRPSGPLTVGALAATLHWADSAVAAGDRGSYLILGGGLYRALSHPTVVGATRLGWTVGFGFVLTTRSRPDLTLEIRYHRIPRWPGTRMSLVPFTLGLAW